MANPFQVSASSSMGAPNEELKGASSGLVGENDLLIVGPGVLGRLVAEKWRQEYPGCQVYGQTVTTDHHDELIKIGIRPSLKGTKLNYRFPYVIFCAPPLQTSDYPGDVREAALSWNGEGSFLFTSSSAPYDCNDNGQCIEDSPVVPIGRSPRTDVLLKAEKEVLERGGSVLRLAGLYKADRGAHAYWLEKGTVELRPDHILNLIHYEVNTLCLQIYNFYFLNYARSTLACQLTSTQQEVPFLVYLTCFRRMLLPFLLQS
ncbi:uncharacterized protein LOC110610344 isoform X2 [Manihot esculenta]|uniref:uncharacterized protein LOC110610344 isoform X2 n=1 Tax=Manihot esculenta TaxID=3983 RepID=UPI001CC663F0|nr:uncharacterized protein LOC110610344 isoform X2 [Manihot esculenta]